MARNRWTRLQQKDEQKDEKLACEPKHMQNNRSCGAAKPHGAEIQPHSHVTAEAQTYTGSSIEIPTLPVGKQIPAVPLPGHESAQSGRMVTTPPLPAMACVVPREQKLCMAQQSRDLISSVDNFVRPVCVAALPYAREVPLPAVTYQLPLAGTACKPHTRSIRSSSGEDDAVATRVAMLQMAKMAAVKSEDYLEAKRIKDQIDALAAPAADVNISLESKRTRDIPGISSPHDIGESDIETLMRPILPSPSEELLDINDVLDSFWSGNSPVLTSEDAMSHATSNTASPQLVQPLSPPLSPPEAKITIRDLEEAKEGRSATHNGMVCAQSQFSIDSWWVCFKDRPMQSSYDAASMEACRSGISTGLTAAACLQVTSAALLCVNAPCLIAACCRTLLSLPVARDAAANDSLLLRRHVRY